MELASNPIILSCDLFGICEFHSPLWELRWVRDSLWREVRKELNVFFSQWHRRSPRLSPCALTKGYKWTVAIPPWPISSPEMGRERKLWLFALQFIFLSFSVRQIFSIWTLRLNIGRPWLLAELFVHVGCSWHILWLRRELVARHVRGFHIWRPQNFRIFCPLPPCHCQKSADFVPFVCFWGSTPPTPTHCGRHIWKPPYYFIHLCPLATVSDTL